MTDFGIRVAITDFGIEIQDRNIGILYLGLGIRIGIEFEKFGIRDLV